MNRIFLKILTVLSCATFIQCSGSPLVGNAQSSETATEKSLTVAVSHVSESNDASVVSTFTNDEGIEITLTRAGLSWGHFTLITEGSDPECAADFDEELHSEGIENVLDAETEVVLATDTVADREYCQYGWELTPDNESSPGLEDLPEIEGASVYVEGTWTDGVSSGSFTVSVADEIHVSAVFQAEEDGVVIDHPFHFHEGEDERTLTFASHPELWFEGVTFAESADELAAAVAANVAAAIGQDLGEH